MLFSYVNKGAHILQWKPTGVDEEVIFCSSLADIEGTAPIRGGIPVCWPWFGPKDTLPQHGFVRTAMWKTIHDAQDDKTTIVGLRLSSEDFVYEQWPFQWQLDLLAEAGQTLKVSLITQNTGNKPMEITQALHTYFNVGNIHKAVIEGFDGKYYIDKTRNGQKAEQKGNLTFHEETDKIYLDTCFARLVDPEWQRQIEIETQGGNAMVVWNPWEAKCKGIKDLMDDDYNRFVCIEAACTPEQVVVLPGHQHLLSMEIKVEK